MFLVVTFKTFHNDCEFQFNISGPFVTNGAGIKAAKKGPDVCLTSECLDAAKKILERIDESVKPCDDFYNFACGQYIKNTIIPDDKVSVDAFSAVRDTLQDQLKTIITAPSEPNEIQPFKMIKKLYAACMNKSKVLDRLGIIHELILSGFKA